jgi:hypothetical protein
MAYYDSSSPFQPYDSYPHAAKGGGGGGGGGRFELDEETRGRSTQPSFSYTSSVSTSYGGGPQSVYYESHEEDEGSTESEDLICQLSLRLELIFRLLVSSGTSLSHILNWKLLLRYRFAVEMDQETPSDEHSPYDTSIETPPTPTTYALTHSRQSSSYFSTRPDLQALPPPPSESDLSSSSFEGFNRATATTHESLADMLVREVSDEFNKGGGDSANAWATREFILPIDLC